VLHLLEGPAPPLPEPLDRLAERWAGAGARQRIAVGTAAVIALLAIAGLGAARSPWGPEAVAVVADRDLPAGAILGSGDVRAVAWPAGLLPTEAVTAPESAIGRQLAASVPQGIPIVGGHLTDHGPATDLPPDRVAFPLAVPDGVAIRPGQQIDILAADPSHGGSRLAGAARVLAVDGTTAWVAIHRDEAPGVAAATNWGRIAIAVLPPDR
jgi:Flp pilus assembly protein CpaB